MNRIKELEKLIGNTPLIKIKYKYNNKIRNIYAKLEWFSLTGSTKDRVALNIIKNAYKNKELLPHQPIIETTSGNMVISFSAIGTYLKHPVTIFMPKFMSSERISLIKLYGANLILCNSFEDCFLQAKEYANKVNGYLCKQFESFIEDKETDVLKLFKADFLSDDLSGRNANQQVLKEIMAKNPRIVGGTADLASSVKAYVKEYGDYSAF